MTIIARNDLEFFPGVGNTHLFPYLESWSGNAKTILTEDGIVGAISAIELDFLPTGERRVSILADGFKQDDGYGNIVPTAEVGFSGAVFLEYNVYDSEFDVWRSTSLKEYVQEIPDAILDSQYGSQYSFVQIDLPSNLLVDQEPISIDGDHRLMLVVVSSDVDLVATDLDAAITIGDYFLAQGYPAYEELLVDPIGNAEILERLTIEYNDLISQTYGYDGDPERLLITTGFPNGQRASAWGDGWLELREPGDASDVLFQPDPVSPDQYGDVNTVEQQERYIEGELLSIEDVASQGWIQSDSSSGVAFESPEYAQTNDGSFAPSRGSIPLAPENEGEVYQTLLWAAGKVALTGIGLFLAAGSSPALALIGAGLTAYSAYSLFQSYQSYISDLVPMLSEQVAKFNVESVDVDSWKEFESYTVERTDEFVIEAAGSQAWTLEVLPAIFARHSDISMKVVVPGGEISGDDHSNRALLTMVDDLYDAKDGRDIVLGQLGDDTLGGGGGDDIVLGGAGNDRVAGGAGSDVLMGGGGDDEIDGDNGSDISFGGNGNDTFFGGDGADLLIGDQGNDTIKLDGTTYFRTSFFAYNAGSVNQIGTHVKQSIAGLKKLDVVSHGGDQTDIVELSSGSDAFFLHDSFSNFHSEVALTEDSAGRASAPRFTDIEAIFGRDGDDLIDLTSPDYSMQGLQMEIYGGSGNDIIWGSDADEIIYGGDGNDIIFAGAGTDLVLGGAGADRFELTGTSTALRIGDFNPQEGDTIRFYNNDRATVLREEGFDSVFFNAVDFTLRLIVDTPTERYYPIVDLMPVEPDNALPIQGVLSVFEDVTLYEY